MTQKEKRKLLQDKHTEKIKNCFLEIVETAEFPNRMEILSEVKKRLRLVCGIENIRKHLIKSGVWEQTKDYAKQKIKEVAA